MLCALMYHLTRLQKGGAVTCLPDSWYGNLHGRASASTGVSWASITMPCSAAGMAGAETERRSKLRRGKTCTGPTADKEPLLCAAAHSAENHHRRPGKCLNLAQNVRPCCSTTAEAGGCYLAQKALHTSLCLLPFLLSARILLPALSYSLWSVQRLTGVLVHLVNKVTADIRRALWWQERTAQHRYLLRLAAESEEQQRQAALSQKRYQLFPASICMLLPKRYRCGISWRQPVGDFQVGSPCLQSIL